MKKIILLLVILGIAAAAVGNIFGGAARLFAQGNTLKGSGNIVTETRPAPRNIHTIESSRGVQVLIAATAGDELLVEADDNLIDRVITETKNGKLQVTIDPAIARLNNLHVTVTVPCNGPLHTLHASSGSKIRNEGVLETDRLEARTSSGSSLDLDARVKEDCEIKAASGSYIDAKITAASCKAQAGSGSRIEAEITATEASVSLSAGSHIDLKGSATKCSAETSAGSSLSASKFEAADFQMKASSGSSARIHCTGQLQAHASSGASIRYSGDCTADITRSSGGNVSRK